MVKSNIKILFLVIQLLLLGATFSYAKTDPKKDGPSIAPVVNISEPAIGQTQKFPCWVAEEKVRAGYLYNYNDTKYASLVRYHGFNTLIVKGWRFHKKKDYTQTFERYRRWGKAGKEQKLHIFIAYNWQPEPEVIIYRRVVFSDGTYGVTVCPRDKEFWQNHLIHVGKEIAKLSLVPSLQIDGIFLDNEWYRSEGLKAQKRSYGQHTCFCDNCFSTFLFTKSYSGETLPVVGPEKREKWLKVNKLLNEYFSFLEKEVRMLARFYEQELHKINPNLILGMYPSPRDRVLKAIARGLGTEDFPMLLFATDSYYKGGHNRIPKNPRKLYKNSEIQALYIAGFLLRKYNNNEIADNLCAAANKCSGYWLYRLSLLWGKPREKEPLAGGSQQEYWQALSRASNNIDKLNNK